MKHIKRSFLNQHTEQEFKEITKGNKFELFYRSSDGERLNKKRTTKQTVAYLKTVNDFYVKGFAHKINGQMFTFPEPNPTLIYFSNAQRHRREVELFKKSLLPKLNASSSKIEDFTHDYYNYFGAVCGTVIFLFTSLESFMNSLLIETDTYVRALPGKTEVFDFKQIQENISFGEKIKTVIPQLKNKNYFKAHPTKAQLIDNLKEFRDNIIHTKSTNEIIQHDFIIKRSFTFDYDEVIDAIAHYMNFHKENYIAECGCDKDF